MHGRTCRCKWWLVLACLGVSLAVAGSLEAANAPVEATCRLRAKRVDDPYGLVNIAARSIPVSSDKPADVNELPKDVTSEASYFEIRLGDRPVKGIVYKVRYGFGKTKLYLDVDGDGSFVGEKCFVGTPSRGSFFGGSTTVRFEQCRVELEDDLGGRSLRFNVLLYPERAVLFSPGSYQLGTLRLGRAVHDAALVDGDFDGRYNTLFSPPVTDRAGVECDMIAVDLNRNGAFDYQRIYEEPVELAPLGRLLVLDGQYYNVQVSADGASFEVSGATPQFGKLSFGGTEVRASLWSDATGYLVDGSDESYPLPAGAYAVVRLTVRKTDDEGGLWSFSSRYPGGAAGRFEILAGQTTSLELGPPFRLQTTVERNGREVRIGLNLIGRGGSIFSPGVIRDRRRIPEPTLKILDEKGEALHSDRFKYG